MHKHTGLEIAVIGMAGKFPGAGNVDEFWDNLKNGIESIRFFSDDELLAEGEDPAILKDERYVKANAFVEGKEFFDAAFFNYRPEEAALMDPQMRILHECVWAAIENAGYDVKTYPKKIGLFTGATENLNWENYAVIKNNDKLVDDYSAQFLRNSDYSNTKISYALNLRGPAVSVNTACSTSLVAIIQACNSLLLGECNMAVAGGVCINSYSKKGYLYVEGMIRSKDGHCRPFDSAASGTVGGEGIGVVVLKRLKQAIADRDNIVAIIKGTGINNDGNDKVGYSAPGVDGQAEAIMMACKMGKIEPESIGMLEAHGTGTQLGDPIEVEALTQAFGKSKEKYCALGSVKSNIGHLDIAAGVAGFIKAVLALKNKQLPPSLHFNTPNAEIDFAESPFYVNNSLKEWQPGKYPLRASVSSFGIGGTNAHIVLEEAPAQTPSSASREYQLLVFSARSATALDRNMQNIRDFLIKNREIPLADIAYTLQVGRTAFDHRRSIICNSVENAIQKLTAADKSNINHPGRKQLVFMFPGQGAQYVNMCYDLYVNEPVFKQTADKCFYILQQMTGKDLTPIIFNNGNGEGSSEIDETQYTQPLLFVVEYALAQLLMYWGIRPDNMIGHSIGEWVAACISGVFSLEDALKLVVKRGSFMQQAEKGQMLAVNITELELSQLLNEYANISLAAVNSSTSCVVSGNSVAIHQFQQVLDLNGYKSRMVRTSHAFHSAMMDDVCEAFKKELSGIHFNMPKVPFISNCSGKQAGQDILGSHYWSGHLRHTVRFADGAAVLLQKKNVVFMEVGPGNTLAGFIRSHELYNEGHQVVSLVRHPRVHGNDQFHLLAGIGALWNNGIEPSWNTFYEQEIRSKVALPTYAFEKTGYPVHVDALKLINQAKSNNPLIRIDSAEWLYTPSWKLLPAYEMAESVQQAGCILLFADHQGVGDALAEKYKANGERIVCVKAGRQFKVLSPFQYEVNPDCSEDCQQLFTCLANDGLLPDHIIHGWGIGCAVDCTIFEPSWNHHFYSLVHIIHACNKTGGMPGKQITVVSSGLHPVLNKETVSAVKSMPVGLLKVLAQEFPSVNTMHIDLPDSREINDTILNELYAILHTTQPGKVITYRNNRRWEQVFEKISVTGKANEPGFSAGAVYLITGGLGALGFAVATYLLNTVKAKVILLNRTGLPEQSRWNSYLKDAEANATVKMKINRLLQLEQYGKDRVMYASCDMADEKNFAVIIGNLEKKWGVVNGIIHAAGIVKGDTIKPVTELTQKDFEQQFAPKIKGIQTLKKVMGSHDLDFCLVISSLSSVLGGLGFGAYAAANVFMDYYIEAGHNSEELSNWISIDLDGLALESLGSGGINGEELVAVLQKAITIKGISRVIVSVYDLHKRLDQWVYGNSMKEVIKTQSNALITGANEAHDHVQAYDKSLTATGNTMLALWKAFFGISAIQPDDNFFDLGGDSLKALTMIARIHKFCNVEIPVREFFNLATVQQLSDYIDAKLTSTQTDGTYVAITPATKKTHYRLSSAQKRLYFLYEWNTTSLAYNLPQFTKLTGTPDMGRLQRTFNKLLAYHEILRTSFKVVKDEPVQFIAANSELPIACYNATEDELEAVFEQFIQPFDLESGPLIRAGLVKLSALQHILMVDMHHIITDGVSQNILNNHFMAIYREQELPPLSLQYKDYAEWQQSEVQRAALKKQLAFWLNEFAGEVPVIGLPADFVRPPVKQYKGSSISFVMGQEETSRLQALAARENVSMFMLILSFCNILLAKLSNQEDIVIGTNTTGRHHADLEQIIGIFVNTLAMRNYPRGSLRFRDFLSAVKINTLACFENQAYQYEELIENLDLHRDMSRNPLFEVMLIYQNHEDPVFSLPELVVEPLYKKHTVSKFDLTFTVAEKNNALHIQVEYAISLFKKDTIDRFMQYFRSIMTTIMADVEVRIEDIKLSASDGAPHAQLYSHMLNK